MPRIALCVALTLASSAASAQRLRQVSRTVHEGRSTQRPSNENNPDERESSRNRSAGGASRPTRSSPWRLSLQRRYLAHPYALGITGFELPGADSSDTRGVAVVMSVEGGLALPTVGRMGVAVRYLFGAIEVELRGSALVESSLDGALWAGLIKVRGAYALTEGGPVRARVLVGAVSYVDALGDAGGAELGAAIEAFPARPWVVSAELSGGLLGRAGMLSARASIGYLIDRTELFAAWSHQWLFPMIEGPVVELAGPSLGLRFWL